MSYLLSMAAVEPDAPPADESTKIGSRPGEILRPTLPTPFSGLIAALFGETKGFSREPVLFTATEPGAGVTWTASAVAAELAAGGRKVLLAEAGVIASLSRREDAVVLCDRVGSDKVWVLGTEQANRSQHPVNSAWGRPTHTLSALREEFPYILLDAPALVKSDVALRLARLTAGSVLVVRKGKTEKRNIMEACRKFTTVGGHVLGCVYNAYE